ncbi:pirin family protein [uncultured Aquimarina sp.]|uniref:pirin family protein n=1 Tax=uncultured Aquimarina sp. TaxID=575652 RepID=UPI002623A987|nr:pirin family protein [uncultured Aquimarina sp.]
MKTIMHKSDTRGKANFGWLNSYHSFSFGNYYNPERMSFGALRVLNDDTVSSGMGFGKHPHDNMEIISIPLEGDLEHKDSMGNTTIIKQGDIQVMSAGTGVFHSEYNKNSDKEVKFLQIWVTPNKKNVTPRYDQISIENKNIKNELYQILSPNPDDNGVWIHQDAWFHLGELETEHTQTYTLKDKKNGVYAFVLEGSVTIEDNILEKRDGLGIWDVEQIKINSNGASKILLMEVPITL